MWPASALVNDVEHEKERYSIAHRVLARLAATAGAKCAASQDGPFGLARRCAQLGAGFCGRILRPVLDPRQTASVDQAQRGEALCALVRPDRGGVAAG